MSGQKTLGRFPGGVSGVPELFFDESEHGLFVLDLVKELVEGFYGVPQCDVATLGGFVSGLFDLEKLP